MTKLKMSREELSAESLRLSALIRQGSEGGLWGDKEPSKQRFSSEQMSNAIKRHHREAAQMWNQGPTPKPDKKNS